MCARLFADLGDKRTFPSESLATIPEADQFWVFLYVLLKLILMTCHYGYLNDVTVNKVCNLLPITEFSFMYSFVPVPPYGPECTIEKPALTSVELLYHPSHSRNR
ncbi:hypothetical protein GOBAR_DD00520 [Gossypium barbadense]|nr:hypothetical protein GOBAR_DD00520 [Gossypium barbadense]